MLKILFFFFILIFTYDAQASVKNKIILKLKQIENLSFSFQQTINKKDEKGNCILSYPKKIFCKYDNINKKIMVSNGKSLVIKNMNSGTYYFYPLKNTPLNLILDKNYLIKTIENLEPRIIDNKYVNFTLIDKNNTINIFFDSKNFNLVGWQTEDIYQNLVIIFISLTEINREIDDKIFTLPERN